MVPEEEDGLGDHQEVVDEDDKQVLNGVKLEKSEGVDDPEKSRRPNLLQEEDPPAVSLPSPTLLGTRV